MFEHEIKFMASLGNSTFSSMKLWSCLEVMLGIIVERVRD